MVDGVLLLVDASEGPLPQTRFVLRKALEARLPVILVVNKVDRPDARIGAGRRRGARAVPRPRRRRGADRVPDRLLQRQGRAASLVEGEEGESLAPLLDLLLERIPAPAHDPATRFRPTSRTSTLRRTSAGSRSAVCGTGRSGAVSRSPGAAPTARVQHGPGARALRHRGARPRRRRGGRARARSSPWPASPTSRSERRSPTRDDPRPLPVITVDEPSLSVTIGINTSPLAGQDGTKLTARQVQARLEQELVGNVSLRVRDTDGPTPGRSRAAASCSSRSWSS